jgi:hypothetical protein
VVYVLLFSILYAISLLNQGAGSVIRHIWLKASVRFLCRVQATLILTDLFSSRIRMDVVGRPDLPRPVPMDGLGSQQR